MEIPDTPDWSCEETEYAERQNRAVSSQLQKQKVGIS